MTPERFWLAAALFHLVVLLGLVRVARRFWSSEACRRPTAAWLPALAADLGGLAVFAYLAAFLAPVVTNTDALRELALGEISVRLWGQALFAEGVLLCGCLALRHRRASQLVRAGALGLVGLGLLAVYVRAYRMEPRMLRVRHHELERVAGGAVGTRDLRILHLTDIQTPTIGEHERRALEAGLAARPDLIVLTGDYVQNELGRRTEERAAFDLRVLMSRVGFNAPLGVFATNGDAGPPCRDVFAGTAVRCLVDESASVALPGGGTMSITGLSRSRGRERRPEALAGAAARRAQGGRARRDLPRSRFRGRASGAGGSRPRRAHARRAGRPALLRSPSHRFAAAAALRGRAPRLRGHAAARLARGGNGAGVRAPLALPLSAGDLRPGRAPPRAACAPRARRRRARALRSVPGFHGFPRNDNRPRRGSARRSHPRPDDRSEIRGTWQSLLRVRVYFSYSFQNG